MENEQLLSGEKKATFQTSDGRKVTIAVPVNTTESGAQVIFNNMIINNEIPNVMSGDSTLDQQDLPFIAKERNAVNLSEQATRNILNPFGAGKTIEAGFRAFADTDFEKNDGRTYGERYRAIKNELTVLDNAYQQLKPVDSAVSDIAGMATSLYAALKGIQTKAPKIYEKITEAKTKFGKTLKMLDWELELVSYKELVRPILYKTFQKIFTIWVRWWFRSRCFCSWWESL